MLMHSEVEALLYAKESELNESELQVVLDTLEAQLGSSRFEQAVCESFDMVRKQAWAEARKLAGDEDDYQDSAKAASQTFFRR